MKKGLVLVLGLISSLLFLTGCNPQSPVEAPESDLEAESINLKEINNNQPESIEGQVLSEEISVTQPLTQVQAPAITIKPEAIYRAVLATGVGEITIQLQAKATPITVNNFVHLARAGFYNQTIFHRVISGFMIQGGDPKGDGTGGPGYQFADEPFEGEYQRGTVAMANAGPNTNGSQFFIMHQDYALPKNYVIFGQVIQGLEVVDAIATAPVKASTTGEKSTPVNPVKIRSVTIIEN